MNKYIVSLHSIPKLKPNVSCIGNFDASHKGHQVLYKKTISLAKKNHLKAYIIVFSKDPNTVLFNESPLYSLETRIKLYKEYDFDGVIIIKVNKSFFIMKANDFINKYLLKFNIKHLVCGYDYKFGKDHKGNCKLLNKYFNHLSVIKAVKYKGKKISTRRIKEAINKNDYYNASRMLGYEFKK